MLGKKGLEVTLVLDGQSSGDSVGEVIKALRAIEVIHGSRCPSGFRLSFEGDRYPAETGSLTDYPILDTGLLDPFIRVQVLVKPEDSDEVVLIDGFVTRQEIAVDSQETATITILGEDVSVKMDLFEISAEYESLTDSAIVKQILGKYSSLGVDPDVTAPSGESAPQDFVPQQNSTDRYYLQMLAARHAFLFYLQPGSTAGKSTAYWGPPVTTGESQKALTTNMGRANNVLSLTLSYDALAPTLTYGQVLDLSQDPASPVAVSIGSADQLPGLASTPPISSSFESLAQDPTGSGFTSQLATLDVRGTLLLHPGLGATDARSVGQAKTNRSIQEVVRVEGEVDTAEYGVILTAPGLVDVRGVGKRYDGTYYVKQVRHSLTLEEGEWSYSQKFVLTREGTGSTITTVAQT